MKIRGPKSPLSSGGAEPLDPRDLQKALRKENFAATLSQLEAQAATAGAGQTTASGSITRSALEEIANGADLSSDEDASSAVRESARCLIRARLGAEHRETEQGLKLVEGLSDYVASDPLLKSKLLNILKKLKAG